MSLPAEQSGLDHAFILLLLRNPAYWILEHSLMLYIQFCGSYFANLSPSFSSAGLSILIKNIQYGLHNQQYRLSKP